MAFKKEIKYLEAKKLKVKERIYDYENSELIKHNKTLQYCVKKRKKEVKILKNIIEALSKIDYN
jgi:acyl-CoA thioesterase FadM